MSAHPKDFLTPASPLSADAIRPFPNSRKIFVPGSRPDLRVGMREVTLTPTPTSQGEEENPPVTVYDTSGPYTDPAANIDLRQGLAGVRSQWILERNDTVQLDGPSSEYGRARERDPKLASLRFDHIRKQSTYFYPNFDPAGKRFLMCPDGIWDLRLEPGLRPIRVTPAPALPYGASDTFPMESACPEDGTWVAWTFGGVATLFPLTNPSPRKLYAHRRGAAQLFFTPGAEYLLSIAFDGLRRSGSLAQGSTEPRKVLVKSGSEHFVLSSNGKWVVVRGGMGPSGGRTFLVVPIGGGEPRRVETGFRGFAFPLAISDDGRYVARNHAGCAGVHDSSLRSCNR